MTVAPCLVAAALLVAGPAATSFASDPQDAAPRAAADGAAAVAAAKARYDQLDDGAALDLLLPLLAADEPPLAATELAARCLFQLRRYDEAVALLARVKAPPASVRILLAQCAAKKGELPLALAQLDELIGHDPLLVAAKVARIRVLIAKNDLRAAAEAIADVRRMDRDLHELIPLSAQVSERRNLLPDALRLYEMVLDTPWRRATLDAHVVSEALEGAARVNFQGGRFDASIRHYVELVKRQPRDAKYRFGLGMSQAMASLHDEAIATLREAVALDPGYDECRMRLAELLKTTGRVEDSVREFEQLRGVPAYRLDATRYLADLALRSGALEKALDYVKEIEGSEPPSPSVLETCGFVREQAGELKPREGRPAPLLRARPAAIHRPLPPRAAARALRRAGGAESRGRSLLARYQKAVPVLPALGKAVAAIQLMPDNPVQMVRLAGVLNVAGQYEPALLWITRALRATPEDPLAHGIAGCIAANTGQNDEALRQFERAQALLGGRGDPKVQGYIEALRNGRPLPLPLGERSTSRRRRVPAATEVTPRGARRSNDEDAKIPRW
jgi:tetratricopeptide (TPR) repeat protein